MVNLFNIKVYGKFFIFNDRGKNELFVDLVVLDVGVLNRRFLIKIMLMFNCVFSFLRLVIFKRGFVNLVILIVLIFVI